MHQDEAGISGEGPTQLGRTTTGLAFRCARSIEDVLAAWHLTYVANRRRGLIPANRHQLFLSQRAVGPQSVVLVGQIGPLIVSTMTATLERPLGLPGDHALGDDLRTIHRPGRLMMELHLFADRRADDERTTDSFLRLLALGWSWGALQGATDCLLATEPSRAAFFRVALGFERLGEPQPGRGQDAPQVTLHRHFASDRNGPEMPVGLRILQEHRAPGNAFDDRYRFDAHEVARSAIGGYLSDHYAIRTAG
jgi:hypothetical protein